MAYSELIKNFDKIRDYMREFYVYGFKSREEYTKKSARSYDDERRRVESWLGDYMHFRQTPDGKNVFLSIDSRISRRNPLYKAWKTKNFTDGDITLHFLLFDIPINMRDGSVIAVGRGNPEWNFSAPHGAGRIMSRTKAKETLDMAAYREAMEGIYTTSVSEQTIDEAPMAYKSLDDIIDVIRDTVDVIDVMKPVYNFKASEEDVPWKKDAEKEKGEELHEGTDSVGIETD